MYTPIRLAAAGFVLAGTLILGPAGDPASEVGILRNRDRDGRRVFPAGGRQHPQFPRLGLPAALHYNSA